MYVMPLRRSVMFVFKFHNAGVNFFFYLIFSAILKFQAFFCFVSSYFDATLYVNVHELLQFFNKNMHFRHTGNLVYRKFLL